MRENPGKMPQNSGVFGGGAAPQADEEASAGCAGRAGLGVLHHLRPRDCERAFAETPSFYPLEQRQREDKARREQADAEQQAGQEQAERVHGERIPGLELNEHQRWVRTGFRRSPLWGDRALGSDHATKANVVSRRLSGLRQPRTLLPPWQTKAQSSSADPGRAQTDCTLRPQRPAMSVKRGSRRLGGDPRRRAMSRASAQVRKGTAAASMASAVPVCAGDRQARIDRRDPQKAASLASSPVATGKSPLNRGMRNWRRSAI